MTRLYDLNNPGWCMFSLDLGIVCNMFSYDKVTSADRQGHPTFGAFIAGQGGSSDLPAQPSSCHHSPSLHIPKQEKARQMLGLIESDCE